ncbi:hypothetical protein JCM19992_01700 [Thermostilla marina]
MRIGGANCRRITAGDRRRLRQADQHGNEHRTENTDDVLHHAPHKFRHILSFKGSYSSDDFAGPDQGARVVGNAFLTTVPKESTNADRPENAPEKIAFAAACDFQFNQEPLLSDMQIP